MDHFDEQLAARLSRLEASVPAFDVNPARRVRRRPLGRATALALAAALALLAVVGGLAIGRFTDPRGPDAPVAPGLACEGITTNACHQHAKEIWAYGSDTSIVGVRVVCDAGRTCDAIGGRATFVVRYADGRQEAVWAGWPPAVIAPGVTPECINVPEAECQRDFGRLVPSLPGDATVVGVSYTCTDTCTQTSGHVDVVAALSDGSAFKFNYGYSSGPRSPAMSVEP